MMKKRLTMLMAVLFATVSLGKSAVFAASWQASHYNYPGAPDSASNVAYVTVYQGSLGAKAVCNYNSHSNTSATTGKTIIECTSHAMSPCTLIKTDYGFCKPDVGNPTPGVTVNYVVTAETSTMNDVFWSKGTITAL